MSIDKNVAIAALVGLIVGGGGVALAAPERADIGEGMHRMRGGEMMDDDDMRGMHGAMGDMMQGLSGKTGDAFDQAFLSEMIVHHQGAVDMANAALKSAKHEEIKTMANAIITAQTAEIKQMQDWQKAWYAGTPTPQ